MFAMVLHNPIVRKYQYSQSLNWYGKIYAQNYHIFLEVWLQHKIFAGNGVHCLLMPLTNCTIFTVHFCHMDINLT